MAKIVSKKKEKVFDKPRTKAQKNEGKDGKKSAPAKAAPIIEEGEDPALVAEVSSFLHGLSAEDPSKPSKGKSHSKQPKSPKPAEQSTKKKQSKSKPPAAAANPAPKAKSASGPFLLQPSQAWYNVLPTLAPPSTPPPASSPSELASLASRGTSLLETDAAAYAASSSSTGNSSADAHFLKSILAGGTLSDRLSALTLLVQASPAHNQAALETLHSMAQRGRARGGREEGLKALRCVVDWWVGGGGPGRKLRYFRDQLLKHPDVTDAHLALWAFEDWLKKYFFGVLQTLETYTLDPLPYVRTQALAFLSTLLRAQPEQEQNLLRLLVNKVGDTDKAVCSRASYHLLQVLQAHPAMKGVVVREVRALVFRLKASTAAQSQPQPSSSTHIRFSDTDGSPTKKEKAKSKEEESARWNSHAWYYASVTLNQVVLTPSDVDRTVARLLVDMYFEMFAEILGTPGAVDDPEAGDGGEPAEAAAKKGRDRGNGKERGKGKKMAKETAGEAGFVEVEDSSSRLVGALLTGVNRALPFAKMHLSEDSAALLQKHIDTLFRITHTSTFNISLQALALILQISTTLTSPSTDAASVGTALRARFYRTLYASLADPRLAASNKQALYLNLLFKALKVDDDPARVAAFVRRFVQLLANGGGAGGGVEFVTGGLFLLGELFTVTPALKPLLGQARAPKGDDEPYDPRKRDPQWAHAFSSPMYELLPLLHHYHPTVALHARQLLAGQPITGAPDLALNTLAHFLDRFVYKNAKKPKPRGSSAMQPSGAGAGVSLARGERGGVPVNDERFWRVGAGDVRVDEEFFRAYFVGKSKRESAMARKVDRRKGRGEDDESGESAEEDVESGEESADGGVEEAEEAGEDSEDGGFDLRGEGSDEDDDEIDEDEIMKAIKQSLPAELQGGGLSDDSDDVPSGLDNDSDEDDNGDESDDDDAAGADEDDGDGFSLAEASDAEDLLSLDADLPDGLIEYDGSDASASDEEAEEWGGIGGANTQGKKRGREDDEGKKERKKRLRSLPTFASYEDYMKLIEDAPEDNL